jgi:tetratricopeptide (TPR) repeat protein
MASRTMFVALLCVFASIGTAPACAADANVVPEVLIDLGAIQRRTGELDEALKHYQDAIEQIEDDSGVYDPRLVPALAGLGAVLHDQGQFEEATQAVDRAMYINRMNAGLHNLQQVELLDQLTESLVAMGEYEAASDKQAYAFSLLKRAYGLRSPEIIPGIYRLAGWYRRIGDVYVARSLYDHAVEVLEDAYGPEDTRLIPALQGLAMTFRLERFPTAAPAAETAPTADFTAGPAHAAQFAGIEQRHNTQLNRYGDGERALKRAVLIYQKAEGVEPASLVKSILDLADWYLLFEKWGPTTAARLDEYFGDPRPLYFPLPQPGMAPYSEKKSGHIDVEYDVSDRGEVTDVRVTDAQPPGILDYRMRRYVRMARFRPRFEEGTPVPATALAYRHRFVYTEREEP